MHSDLNTTGRTSIPFSLLFLLFLLTLSGPSEGQGMLGGSLARSSGYFGDVCRENEDCLDTRWCSVNDWSGYWSRDKQPQKGKCGCVNKQLKQKDHKLIQFFDEISKKCFSAVGKICTKEGHEKNSLGWKLQCVPNAYCHHQEGLGLPMQFGICRCMNGFVEDYRHLCVEEEEEVTKELKQIWANSVGGDIPKAEKVKGQIESDPNKGFNVNSKQLEGWTSTPSTAIRGGPWGVTMLIILATSLCKFIM